MCIPIIAPSVPDEALPAERRALLHGDARAHRRRQDLFPVLLRLQVEELPGRHADDAHLLALGRELLVGADAELHLAAAPDQDQLGLSVIGVGEHVGAALEPGCRRVTAPVEGRNRLAREHERDGRVVKPHQDAPRLDRLVRVAGPDRDEARHRPQRRELLDGLVRRPVLAEPDRVVGEDPDRGDLHQRAEPDRLARVVGEDQVGGAVRPQLREREAVHDACHSVLADSEVEVPAASVLGGEDARRPRRSGRRSWSP